MDRLSDLPAELRNYIYDLLLPQEEHYGLHDRGAIPSICQTSHLIRNESLPLWRSSNVFYVHEYRTATPTQTITQIGAGFRHVQNIFYTQEVIIDGSASIADEEDYIKVHLRNLSMKAPIVIYVTREIEIDISGNCYTVGCQGPLRHAKNIKYLLPLTEHNKKGSNHPAVQKLIRAKIRSMIALMEVLLERDLKEVQSRSMEQQQLLQSHQAERLSQWHEWR